MTSFNKTYFDIVTTSGHKDLFCTVQKVPRIEGFIPEVDLETTLEDSYLEGQVAECRK